MRTIKILLPLLLLALAVTGCQTTITNLTPSEALRTQNGFYTFEVALATRQQAIRQDTIQAFVMIDMDMYPMQPTPLVSNRWEAPIPIPADQKLVHYRYKFEYEYLSIPQRKQGSKMSPPYVLRIRER